MFHGVVGSFFMMRSEGQLVHREKNSPGNNVRDKGARLSLRDKLNKRGLQVTKESEVVSSLPCSIEDIDYASLPDTDEHHTRNAWYVFLELHL